MPKLDFEWQMEIPSNWKMKDISEGKIIALFRNPQVAQQGCQINKALLEGMGWRTAGEKTGQMDEGEIRKD